MPKLTMTVADRFRRSAEENDIEGMLALLAPDVRLFNPMTPEPLEGRERVRPVFAALQRVFQDFRYTRVLTGGAPNDAIVPSRMQAVGFRCRVEVEDIEGIDIFDIDDHGQIATLTVMLRPLAGTHALAKAMGDPSTGTPRTSHE